MSDKPNFLPASIAVELQYPYMDHVVVYTFPRLRKKDAELEDTQRKLGGRKLTPAERFVHVVENVEGWPGLDPKRESETTGEFKSRVLNYFNNEDMQEFAEDALAYRFAAVSPAHTFRSS
jgi:hypothetical protein